MPPSPFLPFTRNAGNARPGTPFYTSAGIDPNTRRSTQATATNPFEGVRTQQGGAFGSGGAANAFGANGLDAYGHNPLEAARTAFESVSGVSGDKLGDTSTWTPEQWQDTTRQFGRIASGDLTSGLASENPFIRSTAQSYAGGHGSEGLPPGQPTVPDGNSGVPPNSGGVPQDTSGTVTTVPPNTQAHLGDFSMIPSTANPPQTPQAQGPNPLIPFLSGQGVGFGGGGQSNPVAPQDGFSTMPQTASLIGTQGPRLPDLNPTSTGMSLSGNGPLGTNQAAQSAMFGGQQPFSGASGMRGGGSYFQRYAPLGMPGPDDRRRRGRQAGTDYQPLGSV